MEREEYNALVERLTPPDEHVHVVELRDDEIARLTLEQARELVVRFGTNSLMALPRKEQEYFAWVRKNDEEVWNDLWGNDEEPYLVSLSYLPDFLPNRRGFLICDLTQGPNFCFSAGNITPEDGKMFVDAAIEIIGNQGQLTMPQAFMVEVWRAPIDQWRFAYMYNLPLAEVKALVGWLITEELLMPYLPEEEESEGNEAAEGSGDLLGSSDLS